MASFTKWLLVCRYALLASAQRGVLLEPGCPQADSEIECHADDSGLLQTPMRRDARALSDMARAGECDMSGCRKLGLEKCQWDDMFKTAADLLGNGTVTELRGSCDTVTRMWTNKVAFRVEECDPRVTAHRDWGPLPQTVPAGSCSLLSTIKSACFYCDAAAVLSDFPYGMPAFTPFSAACLPGSVLGRPGQTLSLMCESHEAPLQAAPAAAAATALNATSSHPQCWECPSTVEPACRISKFEYQACHSLSLAEPRTVDCKKITFSWTGAVRLSLVNATPSPTADSARMDTSAEELREPCESDLLFQKAACEYCDVFLEPSHIVAYSRLMESFSMAPHDCDGVGKPGTSLEIRCIGKSAPEHGAL